MMLGQSKLEEGKDFKEAIRSWTCLEAGIIIWGCGVLRRYESLGRYGLAR